MTNGKLGRRLTPSDDTVASAVGDETVILQLKNGTYFGLDPVGTRVWQMLGEGMTPAAICARLGEEYEVAPDVVAADVQHLLDELEAKEVITAAGSD